MTEVRVEKHFRHPPERVFDAFLDPERVGLWLFRTPDGVLETAEYDPRPGGAFRIVEKRGERSAHHWGEFILLDRPHRIVFDFWVEEAETERTRVTVAFTAAGDGCDVVLSHALSREWAHFAERSIRGWAMILDALETVMETR